MYSLFLNRNTSVLFPFRRLGRKSELCKEGISFFVSWYTLPRAQNFNPIFEFQTPWVRKYPSGTSKLVPLAPTRIWLEIVHYVEIVLLAQNSYLRRNCTLSKNCPAGVKCSRWHFRIIYFWLQLGSA